MKTRIKFIIALVSIVSTVTIVLFLLSQEDITYFYTVGEVLHKPQEFTNKKIRVMGLVEKDTVSWFPRKIELQFRITENGKDFLAVDYQGIKPDLFREGQGVVAEGYLHQKRFIADRLLVKHSEEYTTQEHSQQKKQYYQSLKNI